MTVGVEPQRGLPGSSVPDRPRASTERTSAAPRLRDRPALVALSVGLAVVETVVVWAIGPHTGLALAPQVSAPAPFDVFHDLRWLSVYQPGWAVLVLELVCFLAFRTTMTFLFVSWSWPRELARPSTRSLWRRSLASTALLAVLLIPWVVLLFTTAFVALSWLALVAIPVTVTLAILVHHGVVTARWWHEAPARSSVGAVLVAFTTLTVAGALLATAPSWLRVPIAAGAGLVNAGCWLRITRAIAGRDHARRAQVELVPARPRRPFVVAALVAVMGLVVAGTVVGFVVSKALEDARVGPPLADPAATGLPVLVVKGFNSRWNGDTLQWVRGDFLVRRFSYAGLDARGEPRPYSRHTTHQSLRALAHEMATQVEELHADTGRAVGIVAESEGALVALTYLMGTPDAPVRSIVALSPLLDPGRVYYPPLGEDGWGVASGAIVDGLAAALGRVVPVRVSADTPLFRSIVDEGPALRGLLRCRVPGVRELAVLPLDSALAAPAPTTVRIPYTVRPAVHGGLLGDGTTARLVRRTLLGRPVDTSSAWKRVERVLQASASPWQAPSLVQHLAPRWRGLPEPDDCMGVRRALRSWLGN